VATANALVFSAVSLELWCGRRRAAGLSPAIARGGTAAAALRERREEGEARAIEWMGVSGGAGRRPDQGVEVAGRGAPIAGVRPPRGRHWLGRGRRLRGGERGRGRQAGPLSGPKGRRGWPSSAGPLFHFF